MSNIPQPLSAPLSLTIPLASSSPTGQAPHSPGVSRQRDLDEGCDKAPVEVPQIDIPVEYASPRLSHHEHAECLLGGMINAD
jgi:hypothetical protein